MFKKNFQTLCRLKGVYPSRACIDIGLSAGAFNKWENDTIPRAKTLHKAAEYFGVKADYLLTDTDQWVAYNGTFVPALANETLPASNQPHLEWTQAEIEQNTRATRRMQIVDRTADMTLEQLNQVIGILDLMFPDKNNG